MIVIKYINNDTKTCINNDILNQAEQTPELEDKYIPTLQETHDTTVPWRRSRSPQVHTLTLHLHAQSYILHNVLTHKLS